MTWYWWKHWFWITIIMQAAAIVISLPLTSVDTTFTAKFSNIDKTSVLHLKRESLNFPVSAQSDSEDVVGTSDMEAKELFQARNEWLGKTSSSNKNVTDSSPKDKVSVKQSNEEQSSNKNTSNLAIATPLAPANITHDDDHADDSLTIHTNPPTKNVTQSAALMEETTRLIVVEEESSNGTIVADVIPGLSLNNTGDWLDNGNATTELIDTTVMNDTTEEAIETVNSSENRRMDLISSDRKSKILHAEYRDEIKILNTSLDLKKNVAAFTIHEERSYHTAGNDGSMNAGLITCICLGSFVLTGMIGMGLLLYRRRYVNKPQVLGEPDAAGYIDDSTIRDNSDEMYSLDNDSFLNSLEAMTIQNYWTDSVKHTKL